MTGYLGSAQHKENAERASQLSAKAARNAKAERVRLYYLSPKVCEWQGCQNPIPYEKKSTSRFCGSSCAAFHNTAMRNCSHSKERREKIRQGMLKNSAARGIREEVNGALVFQRRCAFCKNSFATEQRRRRTCSDLCFSALKATRIDVEAAREKGRIAIQKQMAEGRWKGWSGQSAGKRSFPEQYVEQLLQEAGETTYSFQLQVGRYALDFAFEKERVVLEVDGKQHLTAQGLAHDQLRDAYLEEQGWQVFRLRWKTVRTPAGKQHIHAQFEQFLAFLCSVRTP